MNLKNYIRKLNANTNNDDAQKKANKLRRTLLIIGSVCLTLGAFGTILGIGLLIALPFEIIDKSFEITKIVKPLVFFMLGGIILGAGIVSLKMATTINIADDFKNENKEKVENLKCDCGSTLLPEEMFCPKCGRAVKIKCPNCGHIQSKKNDYCDKCGFNLY